MPTQTLTLPILHVLCYNNVYASVAELADALDLGSSAFRRAGSIPVARTNSSFGSWDASCELFSLLKIKQIAAKCVIIAGDKKLGSDHDAGNNSRRGKQATALP